MKPKHLMGVLLVLLLGSGIAKAQTEYGLKICGVEVNSENVKKLNEIKGVTVGAGGHISYSPETNTLSIKDVSMQPERRKSCLSVYSAYKNLPFTLHLEGENQFATDATAFWPECDTRIEGSGKLFIRTNYYGIFVYHGATLTIEDCSLEIVSETDEKGYSGIDGYWNAQPKLVIKNASIYAKASGKENVPYPYAIGGFESISIEGSVITQPSNAEIGSYTFTSSWGGASYTKQFVMSGDKPATEVRIEKVIPYEFEICGVEVNSRNVKKLNEIEGVTVGDGGHITYSPETNTLSIKNVSMQPERRKICLRVYSAYKNLPFTLHLEGKNQFNSTNATAFWTECDARIEGSGELFIRTNDDSGIFVSNDATFAIEDCTLDIVSERDGDGYAGIDGKWNTQPKLVIKNASIYAKASGKEDVPYPYAIGGFESITLEGSVITQPSNAGIGSYTFSCYGTSYTNQFVMSGDKPTTEVRIERTNDLYNFSICGVAVTKRNVDKLDEIPGVTVGDNGHITYSHKDKKLSIKDITMQTSGNVNCIYVGNHSEEKPFILHLEGENQFNSPSETTLYTATNMSIVGSGKLTTKTIESGIFVDLGTSLTIEDCSIVTMPESDGSAYAGINAGWGYQSRLVIKNASIYAKTSGSYKDPGPYAIGGFESIKLEGVTITQPRNAVVGNYSFQWDGTPYTKQFVMSGDTPDTEVGIGGTISYDFRICGVKVTSENEDDLDEIPGVTVGEEGYITYSPETNTLSIKDVTLQTSEGVYAVYVDCQFDDRLFTLSLEGENQFNIPNFLPLYTDADMRIDGSGKLSIRTKGTGIFVANDATLAIEDCTLDIVSDTNGEGRACIDANCSERSHLMIKNASIYAKSSGKENAYYPYAIGGFESILLGGVTITEPRDGVVGSYTVQMDENYYTKQFVMSGDKPATEVRIEKVIPYEFSICGVGVNSGNVKKLNEIKGVTVGAGGHITYSPETNTLSIKNVTLQPSEGVFAVYVDCQSDDQLFTLSLEGENQFNISNCLPLYTDADMRIDGSGKLSIRTKGTGIFVANDATMTIEDCTLDIVSDTNGDGRACIDANCSERSHLMIKNASIYAKSSGKENAHYPYAIGGFESIKLEGVTITEPRDGVVGSYTVQMDENYYTKQFIMSGGKPTKEVKIMKTLAIEEVDVADLRVYPNPATHYVQVEGAKAGVSIALYSLEGIRLLAAEANEAGAVELDLTMLPAGNYVVKAGGKHLKLSVKH